MDDREHGRWLSGEPGVFSNWALGTETSVGRAFLDYRIEEPIGQGGMGVVYLANDVRLKRKVALKLMAPELALDERFRERFVRESELAMSLEHPNVVPIYDAGEADGRLYLAMRRVEGTDLRALLQRAGALEPPRALAIAAQIAHALDAAHARGLVHRDVKPSNVLLDGNEHVYLADFGLTRRQSESGEAPAAVRSLGTPAYLAPEQIEGPIVDGRADVYSLGCLLYECLTGEPPFSAASRLGVAWAHLEEEPPSVTEHNRVLPKAIDGVIRKAMAKDPGERYPTCSALVQAAEAALGLGRSAPPRRALAPLRPRPLLALAAGALVLAALVAAGAISHLFGGGTPELRTAAPNSVAMVDPKTGRLVADVAVGTAPTSVAAGDGAVWVTNTADRTVERIDAQSRSVRQTVRVGDGPSGVALGPRAVWVANGLSGNVSRIDAKTNDVVQTIAVGNSPTAIAFGAGAVWVANSDDRTVSRLNPVTGSVDEPIPVGVAARGITVDGGAVWLSDPVGNAVARLDPTTRSVTRRVSVGSGPTAVASGFGAVWVTNNLDGTVSRIDIERAVVVDTVRVGIAPNGIAVAGDAVWVTDEVAGTLVRIDPRSGDVTRRPLGGRPKGLGYADGSLWVAVQPGDAAHRGGTLRLLTRELVGFDLPDPARSYDSLSWSLLSITSDGLVGFKRVGGVEGNTLVPDLATRLPVPTDGGRTYTFQLREGLRFSNGRIVKPSDVRVTFERVFKASSPGLDFYAGIVGGRACKRKPGLCDLSGGVVADDGHRTVTFRLREPDPEFLYKLALPLAFVVPSGTPSPRARPVPGTGPYRIERYERGRLIRLVRNRHFRAWSSAAQPQGIPDVIEVLGRSDARARLAAVQAGRGDVSDVPDGELDDIRTRYPAQVHIAPRAATIFAQPNTTRPPFDSRLARSAVAFAVDRARLVELAGGSDVVQPTCRVLPPSSPGYRPYCLHTARPDRGSWTAPDLDRARELVRRSGTRGMRVDMITVAEDAVFSGAAQVVSDALRRLGYRVSLRAYANFSVYFEAYYGSAAESAELAFNGWFQDYPAPSNFINGVFACNPYFCDRAFESQSRRVLALQARDQEAATEQWGRLERDLVERAAAIPLVNPKDVAFVSRRVGNFQRHPVFGTLISQLWVR